MVTEGEKRAVGRPHKVPEEAYSELLLVRLKPKHMAQLREVVESEGSNLSVYVRQIVLAQLAESSAAAGARQKESAR